MSVTNEPFQRANDLCRRRAYEQWHRGRSKRQILRSQVGFTTTFTLPIRPQSCQGCLHYHGLAYGTSRGQRHTLVCAMHPYGWPGGDRCPDQLQP